MQKKLLLFLATAIALLALGTVCALVVSNAKQTRREQERARMEAQARVDQEERAGQIERERNRLAQQNDELSQLATSLRQREAHQGSNVNALASRLSNFVTQGQGPAENGPKQAMSDMMQKLMSDPAMREMMRSQQKIALSQMYGALFKDLNLTPEQRQQFLDTLMDQVMSGMTNAGSIFQGQGPRAEALASIKAQEKEMQTKLQTLLGDEKYARYQDYQKTVSDRTLVSSLRQQMEGTGAPLRDEQATQLMDIMREEKARVPPVIPDDPSGGAGALEALSSEETVGRHLQWQQEYHRRLLERATPVLSQAQLKEYQEFLESQLAMQSMGMKMAREMFGGSSPGAGTPTQPVPGPPK